MTTPMQPRSPLDALPPRVGEAEREQARAHHDVTELEADALTYETSRKALEGVVHALNARTAQPILVSAPPRVLPALADPTRADYWRTKANALEAENENLKYKLTIAQTSLGCAMETLTMLLAQRDRLEAALARADAIAQKLAKVAA